MSPITQFGLAALLATTAFAAPAKRDVVTVYVTAAAPAAAVQTPAPAPAPVVPAIPKASKPKIQLPKITEKGLKAGIPYNDGALTNLFTNSKVSWAYNWVSSPQGCTEGLEYVPMLHDNSQMFTSVWQSEASAAIAKGSKHLLAFNEPDLVPGTGGTGISVADAVQAYKTYMNPFAGKAKLGSPGVTNGPAPMGIQYLKDFMSACGTACHVDFMNIHWYDQATNFAAFKKHLLDAHTAFPNKDIWLSEYGAYGSDEQISAFLDQAIPFMESLPWLKRHAYFMASEGKLIKNGVLSSYGSKFISL